MSGGSPVGNALANSQQQTPMGGGSSPLNTGGGMSGGQTQMPNFAGPQQQPGTFMGGFGGQQMPNFGPMVNYGQGNGGGFGDQQMAVPGAFNPSPFMNYGRQPDSSMVAEEYPTVSHFGDMQYRPQRYDPIAAERNYYAQMAKQRRPQQPPPMQNPFQPQQPSYMQDPEYQGYETQARDLGRQMDEYMKKAPMYQQLQELQGKMSPFQQRHQQQEMQRMQQMQAMQQRQFQQPSPFRRGQFQQPAGIQGLMGMLGGRGGMQQPRMTMDMPQTNQPMETLPASFPQTFGRERRYANPSADYRGVNPVSQPAQPAQPVPAPAPAPASAYDYF